EALSTAPEAVPEVWEAAAGASARAFLDRFAEAAPAFGEAPVRDYPRLFAQIMRGEEIRPDAATPHPRVALQSPREARVSSADLVILAGLNEGGWPRLAPPDPWLSRPMRAEIGLPSPERAIGLSAHDFLAAASAREVLITRALKEGGSPTVAARWLIRLTTLIAGIEGGAAALSAVRLRGRDLVSLAGRLSRPETRSPSAPRPAPTPPLSARPRRLSVTEIETLVRDPYAIYAKRILGLAPLDPLGRGADFRDRGIVIHRLMERFTRATEAGLPPDPLPLFLETADETLAEAVPFPELRRIWRARIARFAPWFLAGEATRRQNVTRIEVETKGVMTLATPPGFEVTARADRIDLRPEGAAIYDYKAGDPPSKGKIEAGFNQQLHLQAAILEAGGFADLPAATAATGVYMGLTGRGPGGAQVAVKALSKAVEEHSAQLKTLLVAYADPDQGYSSRARVELSTDQGDYDHLARFGEWEAGDD
ncbi:MAG: PD-(D/E)XK nuclease family protein, partial [Pseudomonadota bacterium]